MAANRAGGPELMPKAAVGLRKHKRVLLLFSAEAVKEKLADPASLARLLNTTNSAIEVHVAFFEDLIFQLEEKAADIIDTANNRSLQEYDVIYFRYWGDSRGHVAAAARFCRINGIPFVDREADQFGSYDKLAQYMGLYEAGILFPRTLVGANDLLLTHYQHYGFVFPLIVKSISGSRGRDNYAVQNESELRRILRDNPTITFVMQEFIPNDGDYRVIVIEDKVALVIARKASGNTHLNNTSRGGKATLIPIDQLPRNVRDLSVRAAQVLGRQIAGVDVVRSLADGRFYCFEVNRSPQIEYAAFEQEKARLLADYLDNRAS